MTLFEERVKMREDLLAGKEPERIPVMASMTLEAACGLAQVNLLETHYNIDLMEQAYEKVCQTIFADSFPSGNFRFAAVYQMLDTVNWVMGSDGTPQHPEIEALHADEYDAYIEAPYSFLIKTLLPRVCKSLNGDPMENSLNLAKAYAHYKQVTGAQIGIIGKLSQKYGYMNGIIKGPQIEAPFDFLSDQLRGFKGINMDIRRQPDKVSRAVEVTLPLMIKVAQSMKLPPGAGPVTCLVPMHLAPYIHRRAFEELWWPTFEKMVVELDRQGIHCYIFAEQDWTRYADFLAQLPESTVVGFEDGDPEVFKAVVGKKHVITGLADPTITLTRSKDECIDYVKRLVDVMAPGGRYYFGWGRSIMDIKSVDISKISAMLEWLHVNTDY